MAQLLGEDKSTAPITVTPEPQFNPCLSLLLPPSFLQHYFKPTTETTPAPTTATTPAREPSRTPARSFIASFLISYRGNLFIVESLI